MTSLKITDADIPSLDGKVAIVTGKQTRSAYYEYWLTQELRAQAEPRELVSPLSRSSVPRAAKLSSSILHHQKMMSLPEPRL